MAEQKPFQNVRLPRERPSGAVRHALRHVWDRSAAAGIISRPLLGGLPLRRWLPQDAHSVFDLVAGLAVAVAGWRSKASVARSVGVGLGLGLVGTTLLTDSRLSLSGLLPIELHELTDYGWGLAAITSPFAGGYARRAPGAAVVQVVAGAAIFLGALVTDYRSRSGMHLGRERMTDPGPISA